MLSSLRSLYLGGRASSTSAEGKTGSCVYSRKLSPASDWISKQAFYQNIMQWAYCVQRLLYLFFIEVHVLFGMVSEPTIAWTAHQHHVLTVPADHVGLWVCLYMLLAFFRNHKLENEYSYIQSYIQSLCVKEPQSIKADMRSKAISSTLQRNSYILLLPWLYFGTLDAYTSRSPNVFSFPLSKSCERYTSKRLPILLTCGTHKNAT